MNIHSVMNATYWKKLIPELSLTVEGGRQNVSPLPLDIGATTRLQLIEEGYLEFPHAIPEQTRQILHKGIVTLRRQAWLPLFAFMYDEYWNLFYSLENLLQLALGNNLRMLPDFWAWYVDPAKEEAGWGPHRDKTFDTLLPDGMPKSVTVWIALTASNPLNGCMYIMPANRDKGYSDFSNNIHNLDPQSIRALPAPAGSVFLWNQRIFHWGGRSSKRAAAPRVSIAFEFQRGDVAPYNQPLLAVPELPAFETRVRLIGKQILQYTHMYKYPQDLLTLAETMVEAK